MNKTTNDFIAKCRARGRISIDDALELAKSLGMFAEGYDIRVAIARDKKQRIRHLLSQVFDTAENDIVRSFRSIRLAHGDRVYIDLFNSANLLELNALIREENKRIQESKRIIKSLKKVKHMITGQISLDDYYGDAL